MDPGPEFSALSDGTLLNIANLLQHVNLSINWKCSKTGQSHLIFSEEKNILSLKLISPLKRVLNSGSDPIIINIEFA